jgi:hypothetical protein
MQQHFDWSFWGSHEFKKSAEYFYVESEKRNQIWGRISEHLLLSGVTRYVLSDHWVKV